MERKIGETFEFEGKKIEVKAASNGCDGCFLKEKCCIDSADLVGTCRAGDRTDKKHVVFVKVQEQQQEQAEPQQGQIEPPKLNLCEMLKDCPKGWGFWSPMLGDVKLHHVRQEAERVSVILKSGATWDINADGTITVGGDTSPEVMLFPNKWQRDWSKFTAAWYKKEESIKPKFKAGDRIRHKETNKDDVYEISKVYDDSYGIVGFNWGIYMKYQDQYELVSNKFDPKTLKPFDRVLCKNGIDLWKAELFSHYDCRREYYPSRCVGNGYLYCIPYNDDTKHLVGTTDEAPDFYKYWEK